MPSEPVRTGLGADGDATWPVEVLLPDPLPVTLAEILTVERFFADLVDAALSPEERSDPRTGPDLRTGNAGGQRAGALPPGRSRQRAQRGTR